MAMLNNEVEILNTVVSSMRALVGEYAGLILRGINGLVIDENGKITKVETSLKSAMSALLNKYSNIVGDYATIKMADSLAPYVKKNKKLNNHLPKQVKDAIKQTIDVSESLIRWSKSRR